MTIGERDLESEGPKKLTSQPRSETETDTANAIPLHAALKRRAKPYPYKTSILYGLAVGTAIIASAFLFGKERPDAVSTDAGAYGIPIESDGEFILYSVGDGRCDAAANVPKYGYDGGDCCEATCSGSGSHSCGSLGFDCKYDPEWKGSFLLEGEGGGAEGGSSVALSASGDIVAIGERGAGHAKVFQRSSTDRSEWERLGQTIEGEGMGYGIALSSEGDVLALSSPTYSEGSSGNKGRVDVYRRHSLTKRQWHSFRVDFFKGESEAYFGSAVALSAKGDVLAVGAPFGNSNRKGQVSIFHLPQSLDHEEEGTEKTEIQIGQQGEDLKGDAQGDWFGSAVAISPDGNLVAVGAPHGDYVRVYKWDGTGWKPRGTKIRGDAHDTRSQFGRSISLAVSYAKNTQEENAVLAIGSPGSNYPFEDAGSVYVYEWDGADWALRGGVPIRGTEKYERHGHTVALSGDGSTVAIGGNWISAAVRTFHWSGNNWVPIGNEFPMEWDSAIALSNDGNMLAIGIPKDNNDQGKTLISELIP